MNSLAQIIGRSAYLEKLKQPEWKAFSRSVRSGLGNSCAICKRADIETHIHHFDYDFNRDPWEYAASEVVLLCRTCHAVMHAELKRFRKFVFSKMSPREFQILNGALTVGLDHYDGLELMHAIAEMVSSPGSIKRFAYAFEHHGVPTPVAPAKKKRKTKVIESTAKDFSLRKV